MSSIENNFSQASALETSIAWLPEQWESWALAKGLTRYRGRQVFEWIHKHGVVDPAQMSNLPQSLRDTLANEGLKDVVHAAELRRSSDGTRTMLLGLQDSARIETVLIPQGGQVASDDEEDDAQPVAQRFTQCISTQVGCAMGCKFCASGQRGLLRNMTASEIVSEVLFARRDLGYLPRNLVIMGMGEPLHNYEALSQALRVWMHEQGCGYSARRITVSTSGLVPQIDALGRDFGGRLVLALSLHAVDDATRSSIMPINERYPIAEVIAALKRYPLGKRHHITIEYTLIGGVNDSLDAADALVKLLHPLPIKVNLIPMNPIEASTLRAPSWERVVAFRDRLIDHGIFTFVRKTRGDDVAAACGQLAMKNDVTELRRKRAELKNAARLQ